MTKTDDPQKYPTEAEAEIAVTATAVPESTAPTSGQGTSEPPIPAGHSRFYCSKCHTVRKQSRLLVGGWS